VSAKLDGKKGVFGQKSLQIDASLTSS